MFIKNLRKLSERGDTIVEVLVVIGVVTLVLGAAFVTTNHSLQATRDAQERGNALKLAESQIEQIRDLAGSDPGSVFISTAFCVDGSGAVASAGSSACAVGTDGNPASEEPIFHLSVEQNANLFTVTNKWSSPSGDGDNTLELKYRAYQ